MARKKLCEEQIRALVAEIVAEEMKDGQLQNINDIEDAMVRIGDMVAREVGAVALAGHTEKIPESACCPKCGRAGVYQEPETRDLITRRGKVPLTEAKFRCPKCRQLFFPSVGPTRD